MLVLKVLPVALALMVLPACTTEDTVPAGAAADTIVIRVATYNIEDLRTADLANAANPRLKQAASVIQRLRPAILLVNEMTYDEAGAPGTGEGDAPGQNARRFVETFLSVSQEEGLEPIRYHTFMPPTNTGQASGFDLDNDGRVVTEYPAVAPATPDGTPVEQTPEERAYGDDAWGFGVFPGQYGMALFVAEDLELLRDSIRTFRLLPWSAMPGARRPVDPATGGAPWHTDEEWAAVRLSSKTHMDAPVRLPNGTVLHVLASHPTPPAFDGPEQRNVLRNHDEIRFWADYLNGAAYIVDDAGHSGGLPPEAPFVLLGDLNADPDEGNALNDPMNTFLLNHARVNGSFVPTATPEGQRAFPDLDPDDTAAWGLRVDYVLPSEGLQVRDGGIFRPVADSGAVPVSDHFPVWLDVAVPPR